MGVGDGLGVANVLVLKRTKIHPLWYYTYSTKVVKEATNSIISPAIVIENTQKLGCTEIIKSKPGDRVRCSRAQLVELAVESHEVYIVIGSRGFSKPAAKRAKTSRSSGVAPLRRTPAQEALHLPKGVLQTR